MNNLNKENFKRGLECRLEGTVWNIFEELRTRQDVFQLSLLPGYVCVWGGGSLDDARLTGFA